VKKEKPTATLGEIKANWEEFARSDPLWSILPIPEKKDNRWTVQELFQSGNNEISRILDYISDKKIPVTFGAMLDFGCGVGRLTQACSRHFAKCVGVDISEGMIELAQKFNADNKKCEFMVNNATDLAVFAHDTFDMIYSNIVFQHIPPVYTKAYIKEFLRIVKPNGIIIFQMTINEVPRVGTKLRNLMKRAIPRPLRQIYKQHKYGTWAIKDMYCIDRNELDSFIIANQGEVLEVVDDPSSLPRYMGVRYCVRRRNEGKQG
jgi:ubiquinone/menaquinone biosynthesis C-methylase UbiE